MSYFYNFKNRSRKQIRNYLFRYLSFRLIAYLRYTYINCSSNSLPKFVWEYRKINFSSTNFMINEIRKEACVRSESVLSLYDGIFCLRVSQKQRDDIPRKGVMYSWLLKFLSRWRKRGVSLQKRYFIPLDKISLDGS